MSNFLPKRYFVGTGFIVFINDNHDLKGLHPNNTEFLNLKSHSTSHQLDIVIYDNTNYAPIFRDGDFVVLRPESVRSIIEVKGFLSDSNVSECATKFISLGRLWKEYSDRYDLYESYFDEGRKLHKPGLFIMGWNVAVDKNEKPRCTGKSLRRKIVSTYRKEFSKDEQIDQKIPMINTACIYDDCVVSAITYIDEDEVGHGYITMRGRFVRYDEKGSPFLDRDCTVWSLLSSIYVHLDSPFNPDYVYFDQSMTLSVLPHEHCGTTDLLTGKDKND
ncbi:hypothetical protein HZS52_16610 [Vreelandella titanicae]|nr:hypothetical protein HZS52_16610 [Halomonas titanicae]